MSATRINGQLVTCERCGKQVFIKAIGEGEADGGFTRWNKFEPLPVGWELVPIPIPFTERVPNRITQKHIMVCPECHEAWDKAVIDGFLKGIPCYHDE